MINAKQQRVEGNGVVLLRGRLATSSQLAYRRFYAELSFGQSTRHPPIARSVQIKMKFIVMLRNPVAPSLITPW
jgi:hypothetical protein